MTPSDARASLLALEALENNQRQLDVDGVEVGVSRQALDELLTAYKALLRPAPVEAVTGGVAWTVELEDAFGLAFEGYSKPADHFSDSHGWGMYLNKRITAVFDILQGMKREAAAPAAPVATSAADAGGGRDGAEARAYQAWLARSGEKHTRARSIAFSYGHRAALSSAATPEPALAAGDGVREAIDEARRCLERDQWCKTTTLDHKTVRKLVAALAAPSPSAVDGKFRIGDRVTKTKGSSWTGHIVGTYSTALTLEGYAVESETEIGSVQVYPAAALSPATAVKEG